MKCPLFVSHVLLEPGKMDLAVMHCIKEECAWWDKPIERCLWLNVSEKLSMIYLELNEIRGIIPQDDRTRERL